MREGVYASIPAQRFLIWLTVAMAMLFGVAYVGLTGFFPPPHAGLSADEVQVLYAEHNIRFRIGTMLGSIAGGFIVPITVVISVQMARLERGAPVWATLQLAAGAVGALFIFLPFIIWAAAAFSPARPPELTLLMHEFGWLVFIAGLSLFPMQLLAMIVVCFTKDEDDRVSAFPRWLGYLTAWELVQSFGGPIAMLFKDGIFAWHGLLPFWLPFVLFGVWLSALVYTLLRALRHQQGGRLSEIAAAAPRNRIPGEAGVWLLIFGEMTVFAAIFASFLHYRGFDVAGFAASQAHLTRAIGLANTLVLLTSSLFVARGVHAARGGDTVRAPRLFAAGLICAIGFIALKSFEYYELVSRGISIDSHAFFAFYFGLTALHLGHVVIGAVFLGLLIAATRQPLAKPVHHALVESAGCFWHMVDLLWIIIFPLLYLVE